MWTINQVKEQKQRREIAREKKNYLLIVERGYRACFHHRQLCSTYHESLPRLSCGSHMLLSCLSSKNLRLFLVCERLRLPRVKLFMVCYAIQCRHRCRYILEWRLLTQLFPPSVYLHQIMKCLRMKGSCIKRREDIRFQFGILFLISPFIFKLDLTLDSQTYSEPRTWKCWRLSLVLIKNQECLNSARLGYFCSKKAHENSRAERARAWISVENCAHGKLKTNRKLRIRGFVQPTKLSLALFFFQLSLIHWIISEIHSFDKNEKIEKFQIFLFLIRKCRKLLLKTCQFKVRSKETMKFQWNFRLKWRQIKIE